MKPCLIFDLDGTLVDSLEGIAASLNRALQQLSLATHSLADVRNFVGDGARTLLERSAPNASENTLNELEAHFKADYGRSWSSGTAPFAGIPEALVGLAQRYRLAVLSNKPHEFTIEMVSKIFPEIEFAMVLGQRSGIPHKPDPAGALEISRSLGVSPGNCLVIGDSTMDLDTARNAGMRSVGVTWGYHDRQRLEASNPHRIITSPEELETISLPSELANH